MQAKFQAKVRDLSGRGSGVVEHPDGRIVFVPGVWPGDEGEFEITQLKKRFAHGRLVQLLRPSPHRVEAPCPHFGLGEDQCGGCPWMMAHPTSQKEHKEKQIRSLWERAGLAVEVLQPLLEAPQSLGYRNRAQFKTDGEVLGYISPRSRQIVDIKTCPVLSPKNQTTLKELRSQLPQPQWRPRRSEPWTVLNINESVDGFAVQPGKDLGFLQGNSAQNEKMKGWLRAQLQEHPHKKALELFCGSGNLTEVIAQEGFEDILALEGSLSSVELLRSRKLAGVRAEALNLYSAQALKKIKRLMPDPDVLVLDPPRTGLDTLGVWAKELETLKEVYYISCQPITFVRDAQRLRVEGFHPVEVRPLDLFPHTPHIELLAKFTR